MTASNDERWGSVYDDLMRGRVVGPVEVEERWFDAVVRRLLREHHETLRKLAEE